MSTKKIDEALGLGEGGIDAFLADLDITTANDKLGNIDDAIKKNVDQIDKQIQEYNNTGIASLDMTKLDTSFTEIQELINVSKLTIKHVYESITSSEMVDSEMVQALAKLLEATHISINEYISMYKNRVSFYDKVRMETLKQKYKLEQMEFKHKLDLEKMAQKDGGNMIDASNGMVNYSQEDLIRSMDKEERGEDQ